MFGSPFKFIRRGIDGPKMSASKIPTRFLNDETASAKLTTEKIALTSYTVSISMKKKIEYYQLW
jgi:hypothetical protein